MMEERKEQMSQSDFGQNALLEPQECPEFNLDPKTLTDLQKELFQWQEYNFGEQKDRRMVLGICEEAGELCHAHLKLEQGIRGNRESLKAEARDAVGDICIYAMNLLSNQHELMPSIKARTDIERTTDLEVIGDAVLNIFCCAGRIETARKSSAANEPRRYPTAPKEESPVVRHIRELFMTVNFFCALVGWNLEQIIRDTWREVGARDWRRFPKNGRTEQI